MPKINADWHRLHPMPKNPTDRERMVWHLAHARECGCRAIPDALRRVMDERGIVPETRAP
ncbi:MAG: hypothetical protein ACOY4T_10180 [Pseudomonadota bacterium]|jgi:hypothetical protein